MAALACVLIAASFHASAKYYGGYHQRAEAPESLPAAELAFDAMYLAFGIPFISLLVGALRLSGLHTRLRSLVRRASRSKATPYVLISVAVATAIFLRFVLLDRMSVTDDEETYLFIARTLLGGHVANTPPIPWEFLRNQFVIVDETRWFGKYPLGHPLLLGLGMLTHSTDVLFGLVAGLTAFVTWRVARRAVGPRRGLLALTLLAVSPHFVWTHATLLSQTTTCMFLMCGLYSLQRWRASGAARWSMLAGAALAMSLLARPLPGILYCAGAATYVLIRGTGRGRTVRSLAALSLPVLLACVVLAAVNFAQSGSPARTGYHAVHGDLGVAAGSLAVFGQSVFANVWRENFWLLGWPLSLAPLLFARARRSAYLIWLPIVSALVYRLLVPKTVVSTTGPTYLMELVPMVVILAADGLVRAERFAVRNLPSAAPAVAAAAPAALLAACVFFVPVQFDSIRRGAMQRHAVWQLLENAAAPRAVVFAEELVDRSKASTWAYFPPNPSPELDDPIVFLRWETGDQPELRALKLAREVFPDRPAFVFTPYPEPTLVPLENLARAQSPGGRLEMEDFAR